MRDALYLSVGLVRHLVADKKGRCHHALSEGREARSFASQCKIVLIIMFLCSSAAVCGARGAAVRPRYRHCHRRLQVSGRWGNGDGCGPSMLMAGTVATLAAA